MDQVIISGLHTCKPKNAPSVGQIKPFILENRGDWTKLRNPDRKKNEVGTFFRVIKAERTQYSDPHGNISFNLELEADVPPPQQAQPQPKYHDRVTPDGHPDEMPSRSNANGAPAAPVQQQAIDTAEQFLMREANLYVAALRLSATVIRQAGNRLGVELSVEDLRQIATHLSMGAQYAGYISHMSDKEQTKKEPY